MTTVALIAALVVCTGPGPSAEPARTINEFAVHDALGVAHGLSDFQQSRFVVLAFIGTQCPLAKLYGPRLDQLASSFRDRGVVVVGINANASDSFQEVKRFATELKLQFPIYRDTHGEAMSQLGATRQLEVFVLDRDRRVKYHGRVDDQYEPGLRKAQPTRDDLRLALDELLAGKEHVSVPETSFAGCFIDRAIKRSAKPVVTYWQDIAPILSTHCVECHRSGQIGPFPLTSYDQVKAWGATIAERVDEGSMPPWHADPMHGRFANEHRLSDEQKAKLHAWLAAGSPEGFAVETRDVPRPAEHAEWQIGIPDKILTMPEPFTVPAQGIIDNIAVELDPGFNGERWIRGTEVRPGNRSVVLHCSVFIGPPGLKALVDSGKGELHYFSDFVPGLMPTLLPRGMARRLPAGWHIYLSLHYVPNGTPAVDQTRFGIVLTEPPEHEVSTGNLLNKCFVIPPHAANVEVSQSWTLPCDMLLLSLFPHMHVRGKSFRYEAVYADGPTEILLSVPHYDFMWQHRYVLAEPKRLPAGTILRGVAVYDNSSANKANPDPNATVIYGKRTDDEMFHGYFDGVMLPPSPRKSATHFALACTALAGCWVIVKRRAAARARTTGPQ